MWVVRLLPALVDCDGGGWNQRTVISLIGGWWDKGWSFENLCSKCMIEWTYPSPESVTVSKRTKFGRRIWPIQESETATQTWLIWIWPVRRLRQLPMASVVIFQLFWKELKPRFPVELPSFHVRKGDKLRPAFKELARLPAISSCMSRGWRSIFATS